MLRTYIIIISFFIATFSYSQIVFENAYFVDLKGEKINCLIKNVDWDLNPTSFKYKTSENSDIKIKEASDVTEFGFENGANYLSVVVKIDLSSDQNNRLTNTRVPEFRNQRLFLKELVAGKSPLYLYKNGDITRFFYLQEDNIVEPLVYKRYFVGIAKIREHERYKQQLLNFIKCDEINDKEVKSLEYSIPSLTKIFRKYNKCLDPNTNFEKESKNKTQINFSIKPGLQSNKVDFLIVDNFFSQGAVFDFGNSFGFRFGLETEFVLPFNKNKWSIVLEPTYQSYNALNTSESFNIKYKSIEVPLGLRHYLYLNNFRFFINVGAVYDIPINSSINENLEISSSINLMYGLGFSLKEKYSLELRRYTRRQLVSNFREVSAEYHVNLAVVLGIRI